jgi:hypothetical protein
VLIPQLLLVLRTRWERVLRQPVINSLPWSGNFLKALDDVCSLATPGGASTSVNQPRQTDPPVVVTVPNSAAPPQQGERQPSPLPPGPPTYDVTNTALIAPSVRQWAERNGLRILEAGSDGSCQFHALAAAEGIAGQGHAVRRDVVQFMSQNAGFQSYARERIGHDRNHETLEEFIERMRASDAWGTEFTLMAYAMMHRVRIICCRSV